MKKDRSKQDANLQSWSKGQSGNPSGRPKGSRNRSTVAKEILNLTAHLPEKVYEALKGQFPEVKRVMTVEEVMNFAMVNQAQKGNVHAYRAIMEMAYGKQEISAPSFGAFEDATAEELEQRFYLPDPRRNE